MRSLQKESLPNPTGWPEGASYPPLRRVIRDGHHGSFLVSRNSARHHLATRRHVLIALVGGMVFPPCICRCWSMLRCWRRPPWSCCELPSPPYPSRLRRNPRSPRSFGFKISASYGCLGVASRLLWTTTKGLGVRPRRGQRALRPTDKRPGHSVALTALTILRSRRPLSAFSPNRSSDPPVPIGPLSQSRA
jgi:hypothetical protein